MNTKKPMSDLDNKLKKDHKSSKDSLVKEILRDTFNDDPGLDEIEYGRNHANEEDHAQKRNQGKKGFKK